MVLPDPGLRPACRRVRRRTESGASGYRSHLRGGFFFCLLCAILLGYKSRRVALEDRERGAASSMLVIMAGMLKDEDNATLERIASKGGPAGQAAGMLLVNRKEKRTEE